MAELVGPPRNRQESEETAIPVQVQGALAPHQRGPGGQLGSQNRVRKSKPLTDAEVTDILWSSRRVSAKELCSFVTPDLINNQDERIAPIIDAINTIINNMARTRRMLLYFKLTKTGNPTEIRILEKNLILWPVQVQEMQGQVEALEGRILRIPHDLVKDLVVH